MAKRKPFYVARERGVAVPVYKYQQRKKGESYAYYTVVDQSGDTRRLLTLSDPEDAKQKADSVAQAIRAGQPELVELDALRLDLAGALDVLRPHGLKLLPAAQLLASALGIVTANELLSACHYWRQRPGKPITPRPVKTTMAEFLARHKVSPRRQRTNTAYLKLFKEQFGERNVCDLQVLDIKDWAWQVPETALVVLKSWELVGKTDGDFNYGACQHPDKLRTAMNHFDDVCDYVKGNNFGNWALDKVLGALARFSGLSLEEIEAFFADEVNAESSSDHEQGHDAWTRLRTEVQAELKYHEKNETQITGSQQKFWLRWVEDYCDFHGEPPRDWKDDFYAVRKQKALDDENLHDRLFQRIGEMFRAYRTWDLTRDKAVGLIDNPPWPILSNILRGDAFKKLLEPRR